jgi:DNA-binding SARP family transcriptional activator
VTTGLSAPVSAEHGGTRDARLPGDRIEFRLLGQLEVIVGTGKALRLGGARLPAMLATLLLNANETVSTEHLSRFLWPQPPRAADSNIRTYIAQLRGLLTTRAEGASRLTTGVSGYRLEVWPGELDVAVFDELVAEGQHALDGGEPDVALDRLRRALDLWRGEPLAGMTGGPQLGVEAARLEQRRLDVAERWAEVALAAGRSDEVAVELARIVPAYPLREQLWVQLMLALYRSGRQAAALAAYRDAYRLLDQELGIRPSRPLQQLHQQILNADPALDAAYLRPSTTLPAAPRPRQLPGDLATFAGRAEALAALDALVADRDGDRPAAVTVAVVAGTAGVGKTSLAVHWAHRVAHRFPDGQLYVNLRGFGPTGPPVSPRDALRGFLDALHVSPQRVPTGLDAQTALYRSLLADRRVLVVLDNARNAEQVWPLLPGGAGCFVVVTSRNRMSGLVAAVGAHPLSLDLLPPAEARDLLARRLGRARVAGDAGALDAIVARCARLPLALSIVAARALTRPDLSLRALAAELDHAEGSLDPFRDTDPAFDLPSVFSWSYRLLGADARALFRRLGSYPDAEIPLSHATLADVPVPRLRRLLAELADAHVVTEQGPGYYACHRLLRAYAAELSVRPDVDPAR